MGTEIGMLGGFGFQGQVTAGDGSDKKGKMGAGYNNLRRKKKKQQCKVGHEEEGSSSNRPELAAFLLALHDTLIAEPLLYLCDNQSLLKAVIRWIGEGGKATLVGAPDVDILAAAIEILRKRIAAGTTTFLVKVKAHRGEPANEGADILSDKAISDPKVGKVGKEWGQRTNRAVFTWKNPCHETGNVSYQDRHSTFDNSVRDEIRKGAAENEVPKHEKRLTGAWRQMSTLRRRYEKWCKGDDIEDCTHKQRYEASYQSMVKVLQQNTWIDDGKFLKLCVQARAEQGNINHPAYGTWTADFILRQNESRAFLGKYLNDQRVPWRHERREMMAIAGIIPVAKWLAKIKQRLDVSRRSCKRAREQRGASTAILPEETYGHTKRAFCDGMATTVTAAHHFIWRHLYASIRAAQTPASKLRVVTPDKESSMNTLWQEEEFEQICSRESLTEKAANIEKTISVKEHEREHYDFDPTMFYENRFWNRRPDGIVINKNHRTLYIIEFKQSSDRHEDFLRVKEDEANERE